MKITDFLISIGCNTINNNYCFHIVALLSIGSSCIISIQDAEKIYLKHLTVKAVNIEKMIVLNGVQDSVFLPITTFLYIITLTISFAHFTILAHLSPIF